MDIEGELNNLQNVVQKLKTAVKDIRVIVNNEKLKIDASRAEFKKKLDNVTIAIASRNKTIDEVKQTTASQGVTTIVELPVAADANESILKEHLGTQNMLLDNLKHVASALENAITSAKYSETVNELVIESNRVNMTPESHALFEDTKKAFKESHDAMTNELMSIQISIGKLKTSIANSETLLKKKEYENQYKRDREVQARHQQIAIWRKMYDDAIVALTKIVTEI